VGIEMSLVLGAVLAPEHNGKRYIIFQSCLVVWRISRLVVWGS
jgi:hypothetical protein